MDRRSIKSDTQLSQFKALGQRATNIAVQNIRKETDYSDAPDEFRGKYFTKLKVQHCRVL